MVTDKIDFNIQLIFFAVILLSAIIGWIVIHYLHRRDRAHLQRKGFRDVEISFKSLVFIGDFSLFQFFEKVHSAYVGIVMQKFLKQPGRTPLNLDSEAYFLPLQREYGKLIIFKRDLLPPLKNNHFEEFENRRLIYQDSADVELRKLLHWYLRKEHELSIEMNCEGILFFYDYSPLSLEQRVEKAEEIYSLFHRFSSKSP